MEVTNSGDLILDSLGTGIPTLTKSKASMLKEACIWCLTTCKHDNGVKIKCTICDDNVYYSIKWKNDVDIDGILRAYNFDDAIEFGAEALSLLLIREKTDFTAIERAVRTTGIDYWLGYKNKDENLIFSKKDARLEISGILRERGSYTLKNRIKSKLKQTQPSDYIFPVFVSIIEFSHPKAETVRKDAIN